MLLALISISLKEIKTLNFPLRSSSLIIITLLIGTVATILQFYSILENYVPIMESIKRTIGQVCAVIFGYIIFKEKNNYSESRWSFNFIDWDILYILIF